MPREPLPKQAMILCGGSGMRLGSLTAATPKPLLAVGGRPFLDVLLLELGRHGITDVMLLAAFEAEQIEQYIADNPLAHRFGMRLRVSVEPERAGTGGALHHARDVADREFLLLNGDSWFDINLLGITGAESTPAVDVVMTVREIEDASRYGVVGMDGDRVTEFLERPRAPGPGLVNAGIYRVRDSIFASLQPKCSFERDVLPSLARSGRVAGVRRSGYFIDIGVPETFARAQIEIPAKQRRKAVFFDRDGVLNHDLGHVGSVDRFQWIDGAREAVRALNDAGYFVFVVTNQAGVARGLYTEHDVATLHEHVDQELASAGAHIDGMRYCPYHADAKFEHYRQASDWRKPAPGMLLDLMSKWDVDREQSHMIGDQPTDIEAGRAAGVTAHCFLGGNLLTFVRGLGLV